MIVETLDPNNIVAKIYSSELNEEQKFEVIQQINKCFKENNVEEYNRIYTSLSK